MEKYLIIIVVLSLAYQVKTKSLGKDDSSEANYGYYEFFGMKISDKNFLPIFFGIPVTEDVETTTNQIVNAPSSNISEKKLQECQDLCKTLTTAQYDPVCGTDGQSYPNAERLRCTRENCKIEVEISRVGACEPQTTAVFQSIGTR